MSDGITGAIGGLCGGLIALAFFITAKLAVDYVSERAAAWLTRRRCRKRPVTDEDLWRNAFEEGIYVFYSDNHPVKTSEFVDYLKVHFEINKEKRDERRNQPM